MKCRVHFYLLNKDFSIEHAEANHNGEESEMNRKYEWEDELNIPLGIDSYKMIEDAVYVLRGIKNEEEFSFDVSKMLIFDLVKDGNVTQVGCSSSILESFEVIEDEEGISIHFYIKDYEPMSNPVSGIFIAAQEFPKELIGE